MPRALAALVLLLTAALPAAAQSNPGHYQGFGDARGFLNIVPPGQDGVLNGPEALQAQGGQYPPHVKDQLAIAPYKESDLTAQLDAIRNSGAEGMSGYMDLLAYTDGANQYINEANTDPSKMPAEYPALQQTPAPWKPEDAVAIASLVGGIFGKGGGGELTNFCGLKAMTAALGSASAARAVFDDLHFANDAEAPTTSHTPAPYMTDLGPVDPAANPDIDCASLQPVDSSAPSLQSLLDAISGASPPLPVPHAMSNALVVSGAHTKSGRPIAVFGPQTGYFVPQLPVQKDVHGPDLAAP